MKPKMSKKIMKDVMRFPIKGRLVTVSFSLGIYIDNGEVDEGELVIKSAFIELRNGHKKEILPNTETHKLMLNEINERLESCVEEFLKTHG